MIKEIHGENQSRKTCGNFSPQQFLLSFLRCLVIVKYDWYDHVVDGLDVLWFGTESYCWVLSSLLGNVARMQA